MISKVSFYRYFFCPVVDCVMCYDILFKNAKKYLLKSTRLDMDYKNPTDDIVVMVYNNLTDCIAGIIGRFRNSEVEHGLYKKLQTVSELPSVYGSLVNEMEIAILTKGIRSFSIFGNPKKYKPQSAANELLKQMGYFILSTKRPHVYVLEEFVRQENKLLPGNPSGKSSLHRR
jgi:hypothetical protein